MDNYTPRLKEIYNTTVAPKLKEDLSISNEMALPKLLKVTLNMGLGEAVNDSKVIQLASEQLSQISGQLPVVTKAKKSIATFKIRTGMPLGVKVTLRGNRMYEFVDRLTTIALPRIRDFRGLSNKGFDGRGNYSFGIKELTIFPEINVDKLDKVRGLDISIGTSAIIFASCKDTFTLSGILISFKPTLDILKNLTNYFATDICLASIRISHHSS